MTNLIKDKCLFWTKATETETEVEVDRGTAVVKRLLPPTVTDDSRCKNVCGADVQTDAGDRFTDRENIKSICIRRE